MARVGSKAVRQAIRRFPEDPANVPRLIELLREPDHPEHRFALARHCYDADEIAAFRARWAVDA